GEEGAGKGKSRGDIAEPKAQPNCGKQERHSYAPIGLIGEGKIGEDPADNTTRSHRNQRSDSSATVRPSVPRLSHASPPRPLAGPGSQPPHSSSPRPYPHLPRMLHHAPISPLALQEL